MSGPEEAGHWLDNEKLDEKIRADIAFNNKQAILVALSCPCCGAGGMNYTAKINRRS